MRLCLILPSRGLVGEDSLGHIYCCKYLLMIVGCVLSFFFCLLYTLTVVHLTIWLEGSGGKMHMTEKNMQIYMC